MATPRHNEDKSTFLMWVSRDETDGYLKIVTVYKRCDQMFKILSKSWVHRTFDHGFFGHRLKIPPVLGKCSAR